MRHAARARSRHLCLEHLTKLACRHIARLNNGHSNAQSICLELEGSVVGAARRTGKILYMRVTTHVDICLQDQAVCQPALTTTSKRTTTPPARQGDLRGPLNFTHLGKATVVPPQSHIILQPPEQRCCTRLCEPAQACSHTHVQTADCQALSLGSMHPVGPTLTTGPMLAPPKAASNCRMHICHKEGQMAPM